MESQFAKDIMDREHAEAFEHLMRESAKQGMKFPLSREGVLLIATFPDVFEGLFAEWPELRPWEER